jgi:GTP-binding protein
MINKLRNIAIIAHVDHGKTTLVDQLLQQSGTLGERFGPVERVMDSNELEKERGITILSKNTSILWEDYRINIVDTPGHADFGGEVERVLSMVDSVLLLVDAVEGPMPQTRFVTQKAFKHGLKPIVVVNKIDREGARPDWVIDQTFDLFDRLGASDEQLDFPIVYASAINGYAGTGDDVHAGDMTPLFQAIIDNCPAPDVDPDGPFQMQVSTLAYTSYLGAIAIGRITRGMVRRNMPVMVVKRDGDQHRAKIGQVFGFAGLERVEVEQASAGDIVAFSGVEAPNVSDTLCDPEQIEPMPPLTVDEPTVSMTFQVNTSPFAGREGKYLTSRQLKERLERELLHNVALRVEEGNDPEKFRVSGRGELHLSILIENMRREGYELAVSRPEVIFREIKGRICEPFELLTVDAADGGCGGAAPGRHHGGPGNPARRAQGHGAGWSGTGASGLCHPVPWVDRLSDRVHDSDLRHRPDLPCVRSLRPGPGGGDCAAQERYPDRQLHRQGPGLRSVQPAGARPPVHPAWGRGL